MTVTNMKTMESMAILVRAVGEASAAAAAVAAAENSYHFRICGT
jgi:hypothetical protein